MLRAKPLFLVYLLLGLSAPLGAATFPCRPCAGVRIEPASDPSLSAGPETFARALRTAKLEPGSPLFIAWEVPLSAEGGTSAQVPATIREAGATPWLSLIFRTPAPLAQGSERLQQELRAAAAIAGQAPAGTWFQVVWRPEGQEGNGFVPTEYAFLLKRAAVALTGARQDALVATEPLPADAQAIAALYGEEVAAYLEAVALQSAAPAAIEAVQTNRSDKEPNPCSETPQRVSDHIDSRTVAMEVGIR